MRKFITEFNDTGVCVVDVPMVCKIWTDKFYISRWIDDYTLVQQHARFNRNIFKIGISAEQAFEIINNKSLLCVQSFLKSGKTYFSANVVNEYLKRYRELQKEKLIEIDIIATNISYLENALC